MYYTVSNKPIYTCDKCGKTFGSQEKVVAHIKDTHPDMKTAKDFVGKYYRYTYNSVVHDVYVSGNCGDEEIFAKELVREPLFGTWFVQDLVFCLGKFLANSKEITKEEFVSDLEENELTKFRTAVAPLLKYMGNAMDIPTRLKA